MRTHGTVSCYCGGCRCQECRDAKAAYLREWRRNGGGTPEAAEARRLRHRARGRALDRLAAMFPDEFRSLHDEERAAVGLPPLADPVAS